MVVKVTKNATAKAEVDVKSDEIASQILNVEAETSTVETPEETLKETPEVAKVTASTVLSSEVGKAVVTQEETLDKEAQRLSAVSSLVKATYIGDLRPAVSFAHYSLTFEHNKPLVLDADSEHRRFLEDYKDSEDFILEKI